MTSPPRPSLRDLLLRSDFGRHDPARVDAVLRAVAPPIDPPSTTCHQPREAEYVDR